MKRCWWGGTLIGQGEGRFACEQTLSMAVFLEIHDPYEKLCLSSKPVSKIKSMLSKSVEAAGLLFPFYWGEVRLCFCFGTNHEVRHLPAVILTLFFKVRPHVKPSHP